MREMGGFGWPLSGVRGSDGAFGGLEDGFGLWKVSFRGPESDGSEFWGSAGRSWRCIDGVVPDAGAF